MSGQGGAAGTRLWWRWPAAAVLLLAGVQAVRTAVVEGLSDSHPALAHALWSSHPKPTLTLALGEIGAAAREGKAPPPQALEAIHRVGKTEPLAAEPLLVAGTQALASGNPQAAERLLEAALRRDPRSTAAHFLLADLLIRQQRLAEALGHVGALGRRLGAATIGFAGALADYLRQPGALAKVAPVLGNDPALRQQVLERLANDPASTPLLVALARPDDAEKAWLVRATDVRLGAGNVEGARRLLARAGVSGGGTALSSWAPGAGGPLTWRFITGSGGVAEAVAGGPVRLVYYGREDTALADHVLLLPAGSYRLRSSFAGKVPPGTFEWRLTCLGTGKPATVLPIEGSNNDSPLSVAPDCAAQKLSLWARMGDFPQTVSTELSRVSLVRAGIAS
jgi:hypothetical protein